MANGLSDTYEQYVLEYIFKRTALPAVPSNLYVSLHGTDPGDTGANELSTAVGGYARALLASDTGNTVDTNWEAVDTSGTSKRISNKLDIVFPAATADWFSGNLIPYWALWDNASAGTCILSGTITGGGIAVHNGNTARFMGSTGLGSAPGQLRALID